MSANGTGAKKKRKSPDGIPTNDLVFSAYTGANDDVFPYILSLYCYFLNGPIIPKPKSSDP